MWARVLTIILGVWLMVAPDLLGYGILASHNGHIVGPLLIAFSTISLWEATDMVRKWNYPLGLWLLLSPWVLGYGLGIALASDMFTGGMVLVLSKVGTTIKNRYGGGWSSLWTRGSGHKGPPRERKKG